MAAAAATAAATAAGVGEGAAAAAATEAAGLTAKRLVRQFAARPSTDGAESATRPLDTPPPIAAEGEAGESTRSRERRRRRSLVQVPSREMRRRSFQMAVQQSAGGALGGSKLADVADLATADASRHGGPLQISEGFYWSSDEPRNAAIVNLGPHPHPNPNTTAKPNADPHPNQERRHR